MTTKKGAPKAQAVTAKLGAAEPIETSFAEVVGLIEQARQRAYQAINTELVGLYWQIGQHISGKLAAAEWGEGVVDRAWPSIWHARYLACAASRRKTCGACGSSSRLTATIQNSHRW